MTSHIFSEDVLQRSTYPQERDLSGAVANYSSLLGELSERTKNNHYLDYRLKKLQKSLLKKSSAITQGRPPEWLAFFTSLIPPEEQNNNTLQVNNADNEAYSFPFIHAKQQFYKHLLKCLPPDTVDEESLNKVYSSIENWYMSRLIETGRFVLHTNYIRSELKYSEWCDRFLLLDSNKNPWFEITKEYPLLIRWLFTIDGYCKKSMEDLFDRLSQDRNEIHSTFSIPRCAKIIKIENGLSDPHRGGQSVIILHFDDGTKLVYKPKPLGIDTEFYQFISSNENDYGIVPLKSIAKADYGWVEHIEIDHAKSLSDNPESIGKASALFWLLNTTDLHSENVAISEKGVFALDLETLLLAPAVKSNSQSENAWRNHSVYTTMLFDFSFGEKIKQNISGFNPSEDLTMLAPQIKFTIENDYVKANAVEPKKVEALANNLSQYSNEVIEKVVESFDALENKELKLHIKKFINNLRSSIRTRIVFRDTYLYARILDKMRQPRFLRDGALMYIDLFYLHSGVAGSSMNDNKLHSLIEDEISQLLQGDIPYFSTNVGNTDLHTSFGKINDFFVFSGKQHALNKIKNFEDSDTKEQKSLINIALGGYCSSKIDDKQYLNEALPIELLKSVSIKIIDSAFCPDNSPARWISMFGDVSGQESRVFIGDEGFFSGSLGILASLQSIEILLRRHNLEDKAISEFLDSQSLLWEKYLEKKRSLTEDVEELLGFSGLGGDIFAQSILLKLHDKRWSFLIKNIDFSLIDFEDKIKKDKWLDVIGGSAGFILGCEFFCSNNFNKKIIEKIEAAQVLCARHIIQSAKPFDKGIAWVIPSEEHPLLAYAHGWAGIVAALSCISKKTTGEVLFKEVNNVISKSICYLDYLLELDGNWFDYRGQKKTKLNRSWCNGIPGILRGLAEVDQYCTDDIRRKTTHFFQEIVSKFGTTETHRFCCGEMGNLDLILDYIRFSDDRDKMSKNLDLPLKIDHIVRSILYRGDKFIPEREFPSLFHGQSGILYTALRYYMPELPSLSGQSINNIQYRALKNAQTSKKMRLGFSS